MLIYFGCIGQNGRSVLSLGWHEQAVLSRQRINYFLSVTQVVIRIWKLKISLHHLANCIKEMYLIKINLDCISNMVLVLFSLSYHWFAKLLLLLLFLKLPISWENSSHGILFIFFFWQENISTIARWYYFASLTLHLWPFRGTDVYCLCCRCQTHHCSWLSQTGSL